MCKQFKAKLFFCNRQLILVIVPTVGFAVSPQKTDPAMIYYKGLKSVHFRINTYLLFRTFHSLLSVAKK